MNQLTKVFDGRELRIVEIENEPWFVAKDACNILDIKNTTDTLKRLDNDERARFNLGRQGSANIVNESGLYELIFASRKPEAKEFKRWIKKDVLPSIRKHGAYMTQDTLERALLNPDTLIQLATNLKEERTQRLIAEQRVNELQPKADYYDSILKNKSLMTISIIAKNYGMSATKMNELLHDLGVQYKQSKTWLLYGKHQEKGYTHTEMIGVQGSDNLKPSTKWTQKGHIFIYELLKKNDILPLIERKEAI